MIEHIEHQRYRKETAGAGDQCFDARRDNDAREPPGAMLTGESRQRESKYLLFVINDS